MTRDLYDEVLNFIRVFQSESTIRLFSDCACFWFAVTLSTRFDNLGTDIVYNPHSVHFATRIGDRVYDITGEISDVDDYVDWSTYEEDDLSLIINNCIYLRGGYGENTIDFR